VAVGGILLEVSGADEGNRTSDLRITNALLYQLSYIGDLIDGVNYKVLQLLQQTNLLVKAKSGVRANQCLSKYPATPIIKRTWSRRSSSTNLIPVTALLIIFYSA
jgi:hypothetical protein